MIKALSLFIATSALSVSAFSAETASIRVQKLSKCKKSSHSRGDFLMKECPTKLSFGERIVISGTHEKGSKEAIKSRMELLVLDAQGRNYYMAEGVRNSMFEPAGKIEILGNKASDQAVIYKLMYQNYGSQDIYFRIVTVRLRSSLNTARQTCVVSTSDSQDEDVKVENKKASKNLEAKYRDLAKSFVSGEDFSSASCVADGHGH